MTSASVSGDPLRSLRIGVLRPDRPGRVVALAEARVIAAELERRLGPVVLDLRIDGPSIDGWSSVANASWPGSVDALVDASALWNAALPPLTTLFGRTIEPVAAEVRQRMLVHIGVIPGEPFELDDQRLAALSELPLRPTDLWLIARAAGGVSVTDPAIRAFGATVGTVEQGELDTAFDAVAAGLSDHPAVEITPARLIAVERSLSDRIAALASESLRNEREAVALIDQLRAENRMLRERLERAELQLALSTRS